MLPSFIPGVVPAISWGRSRTDVIRSIRLRLALWYALSLVACLAGFAWFVDSYVRRETRARIDQELANVAQAFIQLWRSTAADSSRAPPAAAPALATDLLSEARAGEFEFVVFDEAQREIVSNSRQARLRRSHRAPAPVAAPGDSILRRPDLAALFREAGAAGEAFTTLEGPLGTERAHAVAVTRPGRREIVAVILGLESQEATERALRRSFLWLLPVGLLGAFAGGFFLANRALRPVGLMAEQAERIGARTLYERLPIGNPSDELGHLAGAFNHVLERLERAFEGQQRFMAEASHELRTPIAVVRGEADLALTKTDRPAEEYRATLDVIREESRRMTRIVDDLFLLARADAGHQEVTRTRLDLVPLATSAARSVQSLAAAQGITITTDLPHPAVIDGDGGLLVRLLQNLLDNAIKYGNRGGNVWLSLVAGGRRHLVTIRDDGPGVPADAHQRIFDRFYRGPHARSADAVTGSGAGLGLAICRWIAEAHAGTLVLAKSDRTGSEFRLDLPAAEPGQLVS